MAETAGIKLLGISAALGSAASWALGAVLLKEVGDSLSSLAMTLVKGAISVVLLAVALLFFGFTSMERDVLLLLAFSGILGIAISDTCFFEALKDLGPVHLILLMMLGQVFTVLLAVIFLGESPTPQAWGGIGLIVAGVGFVLSADIGGEVRKAGRRGLAFGLAAVVSMSVSYLIIKKDLAGVSAMQATFVRMASGALGIFLLGGVTGKLGAWMNPFKDRKVAVRFTLAICVVTFGGFWLSLLAMKHLDLSIANTLISTEPVFVLPLAAIFLHEKVTGRALGGTVCAVLGIVLLCLN